MADKPADRQLGPLRERVRRLFRTLQATVLCALLFLTSCGDNPAGVDVPEVKRWTVMLYDAVDMNGVYDPIEDFCEYMVSGRDLSVLVFQDTRHDSARVYYVGRDGTRTPVIEMGEVSTGRSETLRMFLEHSKQNYPAERYILAVYGHGQGWLGSCPDATNGNDYLTMEEMRAALEAEGCVDLVLFTGSCLMGAVESACELRDCCEVYVGSEGLSYYAFWYQPMSRISETLSANPGIGSDDLAEAIIGFIEEESSKWSSHIWNVDLTVSAVRAARVHDLVAELDTLALDYLKDPSRLRAVMDSADTDITVFEEQYPDIYDLVEEILEYETADSTRERLEAVRDCVALAVIAECHGEALSGAHGLTVYFPFRSHSGSTDLYDVGTGLDFIADSHWDELLEAYPYPPLTAPDQCPQDSDLSPSPRGVCRRP
jgi:hypothetical protein